MKSLKLNSKLKYFLVGILFVLCSALLVSGLFGINSYARSVTIGTSSNIFVTSTENSRVRAKQVGSGDTAEYYTMFGISDGGSVSYRKNLAYRWMQNNGVDDLLEKREGYLNLEVGFNELNFTNFKLTFESQQFIKDNKDTKTTNYIVFVPVSGENDKVNVVITNDADEVSVSDTTALEKERISIALSNYQDGTYTVTITDNTNTVTGTFENVGGTFSRYSSSTTAPLYPLIFTAEFAEGSEEYADIALYSLNGQSFSLSGVRSELGENETVEYYYGGTVTDELAPVLCLNESINYLTTDSQISLSYTLVDVLSTNTTSQISYFTLKSSQVTESGVVDNLENVESDIYKEVSSSDNQYLVHHADDYNPVATADYNGSVYDEEHFVVDGAVKVAIKITDSSSSASDYVLLDWYINDNYLIKPKGSTVPFVAMARDELGATFAYTNRDGTTSDPDSQEWKNLVADYQEKVTEAADGLRAGSENTFFLPNSKALFSDNSTDFSDLNIAMYYVNSSGQSSVSGKPGTISLSLSASGKYIFTLFVTDARSNAMWYMHNGELVEFTASDIWNMYAAEEDGEFADRFDYLPWFEFEVTSSDLTIEDAEEQDTAYVGSTYSFSSSDFEVNGTSYTTSYRLFLFDSSAYYAENGVNLVYSEFMANKSKLFEEHREYFIEIMSSSQSANEGYYRYKDYAWNGSSSFVPQDDNSFYLVVAALTSTESITRPVQYGYMGILSSAMAESLAGEDTWVQDNLASIILLSIAGAALIGIVVVLLIRPKDKGDLDAQLEDKKSKKSKSSKK